MQIFYKEQSIKSYRRSLLSSSSHACLFVNPSCKHFTKYNRIKSEIYATHRHVIACVCRGKPILQIFYKMQKHHILEIESYASCHVISCVCVEVNPSCKYFTKEQSLHRDKQARSYQWSQACVDVNPSCKYFTKEQNKKSSTVRNATPCHLMRV